ncbi:MAG: hypothetical protein AB1646_02405 [Thermodesulfobacteriota bacterium]
MAEHDEINGRFEGLPKDIARQIYRLDDETSRLRITGSIVVFCALMVLVTLILALVGTTIRLRSDWSVIMLLSSAALSLAGLLFTAWWERRKEIGMIIFEEISDEVEWSHRTFRPWKRTQDQARSRAYEEELEIIHDKLQTALPVPRPPIEIRLALRHFLSATKLPLVPEQYSALLYSLFFLVCMAAAGWLFLVRGW